MKKQLNDMMNSLREKDLIIKEQNSKLSQFINVNTSPISPPTNSLTASQQLGNPFQNPLGFQSNLAQQQINASNIYQNGQFTPQNSNIGNQGQIPFNNGRFLQNNNFVGYPQQQGSGFSVGPFSS